MFNVYRKYKFYISFKMIQATIFELVYIISLFKGTTDLKKVAQSTDYSELLMVLNI